MRQPTVRKTTISIKDTESVHLGIRGNANHTNSVLSSSNSPLFKFKKGMRKISEPVAESA